MAHGLSLELQKIQPAAPRLADRRESRIPRNPKSTRERPGPVVVQAVNQGEFARTSKRQRVKVARFRSPTSKFKVVRADDGTFEKVLDNARAFNEWAATARPPQRVRVERRVANRRARRSRKVNRG